MKEGIRLVIVFAAVVVFSLIMFAHATRTDARINDTSGMSNDAKVVFETKCAKCHGKDGRAKTFRGKLDHARDFTDGDWQGNVTDERLFNSISNGRNSMPDFKNKLSEEEINALVAYVRQFRK